MNKTEIAKAMEEMGVLQPRQAMDSFLEVVTQSLVTGETIHLRGFGRLTPRLRPASVRKHPQTQVAVVVPMTKSISFVLSKRLKERMNITESTERQAPRQIRRRGSSSLGRGNQPRHP